MAKDVLGDILDNAENPFEDKTDRVFGTQASTVRNNIVKEQVVEAKDQLEAKKEKFIPRIFGGPVPSEYGEVVDRWLSVYDRLPQIDFDAVYKELGLLSINSVKTPTLQHLNEQLQKVQASKDRLAEIMKDVLLAHTIKKRAVDVLKDAWGRFTTERNTEGRRGDSVLRVSDFERDFAEVDGILKSCNHILNNLDSLHENLSRRVSIIQLEVKIHDMGRGGNVEFNYNRINPEDYEKGLLDETKDVDPNQPLKAEEAEF